MPKRFTEIAVAEPKQRRGRTAVKSVLVPTEVLQRFLRGKLTFSAAAVAAGLSESAFRYRVENYIEAHGLTRARWKRPSKIDAVEAQRLYAAGWTLQKLADRYGVTRERVRQRIDTKSVRRKGPYQRLCVACGRAFTSTWFARECDDCRHAAQFDLCACGREKRKTSHHCRACQKLPRRFPWQIAVALYRQGYTTADIGAEFGVAAVSVLRALWKCGVRTRSNPTSHVRSRRARRRMSVHEAAELLRSDSQSR